MFVLAFCFPGIFFEMTNDYLRLDHHFLVNFFIWGWCYLAWKYLKGKDDRYLLAGGIITFLFGVTWVASPLFFGLSFLLGIYYWFIRPGFETDYFEFISNSLLIAGGLLAIFCFKGSYELSTDMGTFGWIHCVSISVIGIVSYLFQKLVKRVNLSGRMILYFMVGGGLLFAFCPPLLNGIKIMGNEDYFMNMIAELQSVYTALLKKGSFIYLSDFSDIYGVTFFLWPMFLFLPNCGLFEKEGRIFKDLLIVAILLSFNQMRYSRWHGALIGVVPALVFYQIFHFLRLRFAQEKKFVWKLGLFFIFIFVLILNRKFILFATPEGLTKEKVQAYNWLKANTPDPKGYKTGEKPEYGVLCHWDSGNEIAYFARRPAACSNTFAGLKNMASFYTAKSIKEAYELCASQKFKYIFLEANMLNNEYVAYLKHIKKSFGESNFKLTSKKDFAGFNKNELKNSFYYWLSKTAGLKNNDYFNDNHNFRLVWKAKTSYQGQKPRYSIFEVVKGATVKGKFKPDAKLNSSLFLKTKTGIMSYDKDIVCDLKGNFLVKVCYPTDIKKGVIQTAKEYQIYHNGKKISAFNISEEDIRKGSIKNLGLIQEK
jgi:hypothetical protein